MSIKNSIKWIVLGVLFTIFCLDICFSDTIAYRMHYYESEQIEASIIEFQTNHHGKSTSYYSLIEFSYQGADYVSRVEHRITDKIGEKIQVRINQYDPEKVYRENSLLDMSQHNIYLIMALGLVSFIPICVNKDAGDGIRIDKMNCVTYNGRQVKKIRLGVYYYIAIAFAFSLEIYMIVVSIIYSQTGFVIASIFFALVTAMVVWAKLSSLKHFNILLERGKRVPCVVKNSTIEKKGKDTCRVYDLISIENEGNHYRKECSPKTMELNMGEQVEFLYDILNKGNCHIIKNLKIIDKVF